MTTPRLQRLAMAACLAGFLATATAGCGGPAPVATPRNDGNPVHDIPDDQVFLAYTAIPGFTIDVPDGWPATGQSDGSTMLTDKLNSIRLQTARTANAPTEAAAKTDLTYLKAHTHGFADGRVSTVTRPAGPAILTAYSGDAPPDTLTGKIINDDIERYQFYHQGLLVTVTLTAPHGSNNVDPWRVVTDSLVFT